MNEGLEKAERGRVEHHDARQARGEAGKRCKRGNGKKCRRTLHAVSAAKVMQGGPGGKARQRGLSGWRHRVGFGGLG